MNNLDARLKNVFAQILNVSPDMINDDSSPDDFKSWDSINHMNLILAIEQEFNIQFNEEDIAILLSYEIIRETILSLS